MKQSPALLTGAVTLTLLRLTIPIVISMLLQTTYSLIDLFIVGNFASVADVSAVSIGTTRLIFAGFGWLI